jgi:hypothetical protein
MQLGKDLAHRQRLTIICIYERTRLWARFILINKIDVKDISEIKYPMLALMQIKLYLKKSA